MKHFEIQVWRPGQANGEFKLWCRQDDQQDAEGMKYSAENAYAGSGWLFRIVEWTGRVVSEPVKTLPLRQRRA